VYRYRCGTCRTTSPVVWSWAAVLHVQDRHRRRVHDGHVPDGEQLLRGVPAPDRRPWMWAALVLALPALEWLAQHAL
jgi:hypothetical protein